MHSFYAGLWVSGVFDSFHAGLSVSGVFYSFHAGLSIGGAFYLNYLRNYYNVAVEIIYCSLQKKLSIHWKTYTVWSKFDEKYSQDWKHSVVFYWKLIYQYIFAINLFSQYLPILGKLFTSVDVGRVSPSLAILICSRSSYPVNFPSIATDPGKLTARLAWYITTWLKMERRSWNIL